MADGEPLLLHYRSLLRTKVCIRQPEERRRAAGKCGLCNLIPNICIAFTSSFNAHEGLAIGEFDTIGSGVGSAHRSQISL